MDTQYWTHSQHTISDHACTMTLTLEMSPRVKAMTHHWVVDNYLV